MTKALLNEALQGGLAKAVDLPKLWDWIRLDDKMIKIVIQSGQTESSGEAIADGPA